ncbi:MAG: hypothetical protein HFH05_10370 [Lachnospiraceae bacterium]|nr:hypothetical protein [Lachnospiraceae bacterium]
MSADAYRNEDFYRGDEPELINIKRNPYLVDYEQHRKLWENREQRSAQREQRAYEASQKNQRASQRTSRRAASFWEQENRGGARENQESRKLSWEERELQRELRREREQERASRRERELQRAPQRERELQRAPRRERELQRAPQRERELQRAPQRERELQRAPQRERELQRAPQRERELQGALRREREWEISNVSPREQEAHRASRRPQGMQQAQRNGRTFQAEPIRKGKIDFYPDAYSQAQGRRAAMEKKRAAARRRRIVKMQRMVLFSGIFFISLLCGILFMKRMDNETPEPSIKTPPQNFLEDVQPVVSSSLVQGLSATDYAKHPEWEENFLTPNEYSRPGEALEEISSIFVHYTANPNTSAAQNRSYFEQLKDTHITSASAHFIIGYDGEIIQCIPLDEIAYAVQSRNYDSVSIECCYKSADGSFTQETYDSLIDLLAWLTDVYHLSTDDILRHYDCGGKKCPIYYTEHEDAWERLKKDVAEKL